MPEENDPQPQSDAMSMEGARLTVPVEIDTSKAERQAEEFATKFKASITEAMREAMKVDDFAASVKVKLGEALRAAMEDATSTKIETVSEGGEGKAGVAVVRENPLVEAIRKQTEAIDANTDRLTQILDTLENPNRGR